MEDGHYFLDSRPSERLDLCSLFMNLGLLQLCNQENMEEALLSLFLGPSLRDQRFQLCLIGQTLQEP